MYLNALRSFLNRYLYIYSKTVTLYYPTRYFKSKKSCGVYYTFEIRISVKLFLDLNRFRTIGGVLGMEGKEDRAALPSLIVGDWDSL